MLGEDPLGEIEGTEYFYPGAGDPEPLKGQMVHILTVGCVPTVGPWNPEHCLGWAPLNARSRKKEDIIRNLPLRAQKPRSA